MVAEHPYAGWVLSSGVVIEVKARLSAEALTTFLQQLLQQVGLSQQATIRTGSRTPPDTSLWE